MANITIYDIAKSADCSPATVSLALNNDPRVKESTKKKVLDIAQSLHYTPNIIAQSLIKKVSQTIGIITPNIENPFYACMLSGIEECAFKYNYSIIMCISNSDLSKEKESLDILMKKRVDGIIFFPTYLDEIKEELEKVIKDVPIVLCGSSGKNIGGLNFVKCDNRRGAFLAINHLISRGHKRIGFILPVFDKSQCESRVRGYCEALAKKEIPYDPRLIKYCTPIETNIYNATVELVEECKPTAIFCLYDYCALVVSGALLSKGLRIPDDVALMGYDNIPISNYYSVPLSTVDTHGNVVGKNATEMLIRKISSPKGKIDPLILEPELIIRKST